MSSNDIEIVMNLTGLELREWGVMASVDATGGEWIRAPGLPEPLQLIPWPRATRRGRGEQREEPQGEPSGERGEHSFEVELQAALTLSVQQAQLHSSSC